MAPINNNPNQPDANGVDYPDELNEAKLQAEMANQVGPERLEEELKYIAILKKNLKEGYYSKSLEDLNEMESHFRNIGMPGVSDTAKARKLAGLREEAIIESKVLREQERDWRQLNQQEQGEIAERIKWGADYQNYWDIIFDAAKADGVIFKDSPSDPQGQKAKQNLIKMVGDELELLLSRDPQNQDKAKDNKLIDNLAKKIIADKNFITLVNQQILGPRNIRSIRTEIERLMKENLTNEAAGNL